MNTTRHNDFLTGVDMNAELHIIGCGSIGTIAATTLARMGFKNFVLYDDDDVEEHNIANQYFEDSDIGLSKTVCLMGKITGINPEANVTCHSNFDEFCGVNDGTVYIVGTDNMASRKMVFDAALTKSVLIVDGRMGGEQGQVHVCRTDSADAYEKYRKTLYSDDDSSPLPCTARTIIYTVAIVANLMAKLTLDFIRGGEYSLVSYAVDMKQVSIEPLLTVKNKTTVRDK